VFSERLHDALPDHADRVLARIDQLQRGDRTRWEATWALFELTRRRLGLDGRPPDAPASFRRAGTRQLAMFDGSRRVSTT
jgi:hypothetical protein